MAQSAVTLQELLDRLGGDVTHRCAEGAAEQQVIEDRRWRGGEYRCRQPLTASPADPRTLGA
jgi:hypothetical protein